MRKQYLVNLLTLGEDALNVLLVEELIYRYRACDDADIVVYIGSPMKRGAKLEGIGGMLIVSGGIQR